MIGSVPSVAIQETVDDVLGVKVSLISSDYGREPWTPGSCLVLCHNLPRWNLLRASVANIQVPSRLSRRPPQKIGCASRFAGILPCRLVMSEVQRVYIMARRSSVLWRDSELNRERLAACSGDSSGRQLPSAIRQGGHPAQSPPIPRLHCAVAEPPGLCSVGRSGSGQFRLRSARPAHFLPSPGHPRAGFCV